MKYLISLLFVFCFLFAIDSYAQSGRNVEFFKDTEAFELAKAVNSENLKRIEKLVKENPRLLSVTSSSGSNVLVLSIYIDKYKSFKKLLELGAEPNFITPDSKYSVLIHACKIFDKGPKPLFDNRYAALLLEYGADPEYALEEDFTNDKGITSMATSPLMRAARLDLELVKLLIKYGANPYKPLGKTSRTPFSQAVSSNRFEIIYYFIDELKIDVHQPLAIRENGNLYVQDFIKKFMNYIPSTAGDEKKQELIKHLEARGIDFKNYDYK
ncbi:ankyrin repeat domain-containing protein [Nibribacter koreensis]|uniref:Ankyrin repeat-containing protein n=1 Tax=Nibribacter koreensis TaxID=1084519 RepID=A0ABP8FAX0_9BACT